MTALLEAKNLSVDFTSAAGATRALRGASFSIAPGRILGIVGESGSGKSVMCRAVMGLLPKHAKVSGDVWFDGNRLTGMASQDLQKIRGREISMIFQNPSSHLDPLMTIGNHVAEPLRRHFGLSKREARGEALKLLDTVRIRDAAQRFDAYPHQLSGGMKQRVLIAAALACRPRMLLADEPTTALDVTVQAGILDLLRGLNREHGLTMALVSHDLGVIAEICDDVLVMRNGEIVERGPVADVIMRPRHDYTRMLIGSQPGKLDRLTEKGADTEAILEVDRLKVHFSEGGRLASLFGQAAGTVRAVDDISFKVASGECFGIVGESGSGKSTVARALVGLVDVTGGDIRSNGVSVVNLSGPALAEHRRHVQMIFQSPYDSLNPRMTVLDIIAEPTWRHGIAGRDAAKDRALELMDLVELPRDLATRKPRQLSGGQCQRVGIARALGLSPRLLIADEVTSALDVTIQAQVLKLLARLRRTHDLTIVYISHDLTVVRKFCDRVAVFRHGKLVETGRTEDVFSAPKEQYTRELIAAAPDLDAMTSREVAP